MKKISTTIKRKCYDLKMIDLKKYGRFIEYKPKNKFWTTRINNIINHGTGALREETEIILLVGAEPHRFDVSEIFLTEVIPARYRSAVDKTSQFYCIVCQSKSRKDAFDRIGRDLDPLFSDNEFRP